MTFGSLFAGVGGFDLGFERAGMKCLWQCEINPQCRELLRKRFATEIYDDVTTILNHQLAPVDVVCGGFPCQDLSVAGRRAGLSGARSGLFYDACRVLDIMRPRYVVIENVPGLLSSNGGRDMQAVIDSLVQLGYGVAYRTLDSRYFGVAQRRRRVFIVGHLGGRPPAEILFEPESLRRDSAKGKGEGQDITPTLTSGSGERGWNKDHPLTVGTLSPGAHPGGFNGQDAYTGHLIPFDLTQITSKTNRSTYEPVPPVAPCLNAHRQRLDAESETLVAGTLAASGAGSSRPAGQANETDMLVAQAVGVRRLTPTECERLQGFPDGWTSGSSDSTRYRMLGNAITTHVGSWIGFRIRAVSEGKDPSHYAGEWLQTVSAQKAKYTIRGDSQRC